MKKSVGDKRIVVVQSGWVFIGEYHAAQGATPAYINDASCIRTWGTTRGLGEIALNGPTKSTVLEPCGVVVLDSPQSVLFTLQCND